MGILPTQLQSVTDNLSSDFQNQLNSHLSSSVGQTGFQISGTPWENSRIADPWFQSISIMPERWDQFFPYRLLVIDTYNGNVIVNGSSQIQTTINSYDPTITWQAIGSQWLFQLPISPQQLNITDQFAIATTATLRGVLEEHNSVKFKLISAQGTMGVWPYKASVVAPPGSPSLVQSLFGGTIAAASSLLTQVSHVINLATSNHPASKPTTKRPQQTPEGYGSTGYYQAMFLQQFLEQYAVAKKDPANAGWRLVFDIPKQNQSYIVTPMAFTWQQSQNDPLKINYSIQFKAWRRIDLKEAKPTTTDAPAPLSPTGLQNILNILTAARSAMSASLNLIGAVTSDLEAPLTALQQATLLVKDLAGVAVTVADLPSQIINAYSSAIKTAINTLSNTIQTTSTSAAVVAATAAVVASTVAAEGLSLGAVQSGQLGPGAAAATNSDPSNNIFSNSNANFDLFDQVPISNLSLNPTQQATVNNIVQQAQQTTVAQLKGYRSTLLNLALLLSNSFGTGSAYYNQIYGLPAPTPRIQPITLDEYDLLTALYQSIQSLDILSATTQIDDNNIQTSMQYVAGLANLANIPFDQTQSKILAPVPFGLNIEQISLRYLGDPNRWIEIATLNSLRDPYIDENGFQYPLLSNATGRQIVVGSNQYLYIGQTVILMSATQQASPRTILGIEVLSTTSFLLTLDGLANLNNFVTVDSAYIQAYLPGTVNSQQKIYIPSNLPVPNVVNILQPTSTTADPLTALSKVDLLLTDSGDLAINNYGDFRFSSGITNIMQALKIKIGTPLGRVVTHPDFGLFLTPGIMNSDLSVQDVFNNLNNLIQQDPRFAGINTLQVNLNGPTLSINMAVALAGIEGVFPVNFVLTNPN